MKVYTLWGDGDTYQAFSAANEDDVDRLIDGFRGKPMGDEWTPVPIKPLLQDEKDAGRPLADLPSFGRRPMFSARAVEELGDLLEGRGELLPLLSDQGEYYAFNVTRLSDALDEEHTEFPRFDSGRAMDIDEYQFMPERLSDETIFKLPQIPEMYTFVTDPFVERVRERGLEGFLSQPVWNSPDSQVSPSHGQQQT